MELNKVISDLEVTIASLQKTVDDLKLQQATEVKEKAIYVEEPKTVVEQVKPIVEQPKVETAEQPNVEVQHIVNVQKSVEKVEPKPIEPKVQTVVNNQATANVQNNKPNINTEGIAQWTAQQQQYYRQKQQSQSSIDLESFVGKKLFVLLASLLIFIGIVVFAKAIIPYFSDEIKFALMCLISVGFATASYIYIRNKQNILSISLLACGLGTVYITLFTGNLYFDIIPSSILYLALLFWTLIVWYCSKYKTIVFNIIGQLGIIVSLLLCITDSLVHSSPENIVYALVYVTIAEILYDILFKEKGYLINMTSMLLSVFILAFPILLEVSENYRYSFIPYDIDKIPLSELIYCPLGKLISIVILAFLFLYAITRNIIYFKKQQINIYEYIIMNILSLFVFLVSMAHFEFTTSAGVIAILFCITMFVMTELMFFNSERHIIVDILSGILLAIATVYYYISFDNIYISGIIILTALMIYCVSTNTTLNKYVVYIYTGIITFINVVYVHIADKAKFLYEQDYGFLEEDAWYKYVDDFNNVGELNISAITYFLTCVLFVAICYMIFRRAIKKSNSPNVQYTKILTYAFVILNVLSSFISVSKCPYRIDEIYDIISADTYDLLRLLAIIGISVLIQVLFRFDGFFKKENLFNQVTFWVYFVANAKMMIASCIFLYDLDGNIPLYIIGVAFTIILFTLNTDILFIKENTPITVYVGIKVLILLLIITHVIEIQPIVSIMMFLWATTCIIIGMKCKQKYLRIYALILALVSSVKLALLDISYSNTISRAFSLILCGFLCFIIVYIYGKLDKIEKKE